MTRERKCDKCGITETEYPARFSPEKFEYWGELWLKAKLWSGDPGDHFYDICPACVSQFEDRVANFFYEEEGGDE